MKVHDKEVARITLLIGDNTFLGVSHLSQERTRDRTDKLKIESILEVICSALSYGATGYTFSTHPINSQILDALRASGEFPGQFDLYPVVPYAEAYVRLANEKGMTGLMNEVLSRLSMQDKAKVLFEGGYSALRLDPVGLFIAYLDAELKGYLSVKPKNAILRGVLLAEVATDLCLGFEGIHLLNKFAQHVRDSYKVLPGFVTYNLPRFVRLFREAGLSLQDVIIMTPFNSLGYQMSPSRDACERSLSSLQQGHVIAMSIMAGGYLDLNEAFDYIRTLPRLSGIAVGVSSTKHAEETFTKFGMLQKNTPNHVTQSIDSSEWRTL